MSVEITEYTDGGPYREQNKKAVLSQGEPRDAAVNFDTNRILERRRAVSVLQLGFVVYYLYKSHFTTCLLTVCVSI